MIRVINRAYADMVKELAKTLVSTKRLILELSKGEEVPVLACPILSPVDGDNNHGHRAISEMLVGLGRYKWECPFCGKLFQD